MGDEGLECGEGGSWLVRLLDGAEESTSEIAGPHLKATAVELRSGG